MTIKDRHCILIEVEDSENTATYIKKKVQKDFPEVKIRFYKEVY